MGRMKRQMRITTPQMAFMAAGLQAGMSQRGGKGLLQYLTASTTGQEAIQEAIINQAAGLPDFPQLKPDLPERDTRRLGT